MSSRYKSKAQKSRRPPKKSRRRPPKKSRRPPKKSRRPPKKSRRPPKKSRRPPKKSRRPPKKSRLAKKSHGSRVGRFLSATSREFGDGPFGFSMSHSSSYLHAIINEINKIKNSDKATRDYYHYKNNSGLSLGAIKILLGSCQPQWRHINNALKIGVAKGHLKKTKGRYKVIKIKQSKKKSRRRAKTVAQKRADCKKKKLVYDTNTGRCRARKKPGRKLKKSHVKSRKPKKAVKKKGKMKKSKFKMQHEKPKLTEKRAKKRRRVTTAGHISTHAASTTTSFKKRADTETEFNNLLTAVNTALDEEPGIVKISMVIPTRRYNEGKKHDGHTFALARDDTTLIVYDTHQVQYMMNDWDPPVWGNYRNLINTMANPTFFSPNGTATSSPQDRTIYFFYDIPLFKEVVASCGKGDDGDVEGSCHEYIMALERKGLLMKPPSAIKYMQTRSQNFPPIIPIPPNDRNWAGIVNTEKRESDQPGAKEWFEDEDEDGYGDVMMKWIPVDRDLGLWEKKHGQFQGPALQTEMTTLSEHDQSSVSDYSEDNSDEESVLSWNTPMTYPTDTGPTVLTPAQLMSMPLPTQDTTGGSSNVSFGLDPDFNLDDLDDFDF